MKKQGFTLIELIGVIILLSIITSIAIPSVINIIKNSKQEMYNTQIDNIKLASQNWATDNASILPTNENGKIVMTLGQLKIMGYAKEDITNPLTDKTFSNETMVTIEYVNGAYIYSIDETTIEDEEVNNYDENMPTIILYGNVVSYVELNSGVYSEPGFIVLDKDGNIINNSLVTVTLSSPIDNKISNSAYVITYYIEQGGYSFTTKRNVIVRDTIPPTLFIGNNLVIFEDDNINLLNGIVARDNDNETVNVEVSGFDRLPGIKTVTYTAIDSSGNKTSKSKVIEVKMAPFDINFEIVGTPFNSDGWANANFYIKTTLVNKSAVSLSGYKWCNSTSECTPSTTAGGMTGNILVSNESANNVVCVSAVNNSGYSKTKCSDYYKLDKTGPIFSGIGDTTIQRYGTIDLAKDVSITDALSGLNSTYSYNPTTIDTSSVGTTNVTYTAVDKLGNSTSIVRKIIVDSLAPSMTYTTDGIFNSHGWAKASFNVNVNVTDYSGLGIKTILYCTTTSTCTPSTTTTNTNFNVNITANGANRVCVQATDNNNKVSEVVCSDNYKLDTTTNAISITAASDGVTIAYSDAVSGADTIYYSLSGATTKDNGLYTGKFAVTNVGTTTVTSYAYDLAGNMTTNYTKNVIISSPGCSAATCSSTYTANYSDGAYSCYSSCASGWTDSGSQCYQGASYTSYYYCTSGTLSGSSCLTTSGVTGANFFTCVGGSWAPAGQTNIGCGGCSDMGYWCEAGPSGSCTSGATTSSACHKTCQCSSGASVGGYYYCNTGSLSGSSCYTSRPTTTCYSPYYYCNGSDSLSGTTCTTTVSSCPGSNYSGTYNLCYKTS